MFRDTKKIHETCHDWWAILCGKVSTCFTRDLRATIATRRTAIGCLKVPEILKNQKILIKLIILENMSENFCTF